MHRFELPRLPPQGRSALALLATGLYAILALVALYVPIAHNAPFVRLFGTPDLARDAMIGFARLLFWPLAAMLLVVVMQEVLVMLKSGPGKAG